MGWPAYRKRHCVLALYLFRFWFKHSFVWVAWSQVCCRFAGFFALVCLVVLNVFAWLCWVNVFVGRKKCLGNICLGNIGFVFCPASCCCYVFTFAMLCDLTNVFITSFYRSSFIFTYGITS